MATSASSKRKGSSSDEGSSEEGCHEPSGGRTTNKILHITLYQKVEQLVRAVVLLVLLITSAPCFLALLALVYFLPEKSHLKKQVRTYCCVGVGRMFMAASGVQLSVQNREALSKLPAMDENGVLMLFTHGSNLDGFAISACFDILSKEQLPLGVVAKKSLFKIPILGTLFRLTGVVAIDRAKHSQAISQLDSAVSHIDSGYVVGVSPEGTRRRTPSWGPDQLKPFKKGPFHMVRQIKSKTFLPATLFGANAAWPPGSLFPIPGAKVTVRFGDPVKVDATKDVTEIQAETRELFKKEIVAGMAGKPYSQDTAFSLGTPVPRSSLWSSTLLLFLPLVAAIMSKLALHRT
ncbi:1-acyl-sn-glycerol-3-phosphate acyltransferase, putative [Perkinsus marinus ATCC 50983]|uniref:1-acyl-sn-glycerol-3-phosphate acyltransferase, putative n=1 Tax=Perkinsus marinus (strain ATCC 50983 / TXsc) TaxID=423536 RepID=C5L3Z3_PERM5|nr:1-acyl-sn-glycerol-3-phosphate acyltransferase, putative [Perkinsus marinus ATCC 50983]EER08722.1 1-acyl-sn-glycerol-3-phosphate acyltransferase, putative [Perkinsus marinus ATCC 50983]|eukprot:XP_002776906.1 1-acyl-sn-glycerol-3-phosphate acyltransferase, putative [Perkinsus marinus ATCC 50983]